MNKEEPIINENGKAFNGNTGAVLVALATVGMGAVFALAAIIKSVWRLAF